MSLPKINDKIFKTLFKDASVTAWVYPTGKKIKGSNFDPDLNTGYEKTFQNPLPIKVITKQLSGNSLILRQIGNINVGSIFIITEKKNLGLLKSSHKIRIEDKNYTAYHDVVGNRFQVFESDYHGFIKAIIFRNDV